MDLLAVELEIMSSKYIVDGSKCLIEVVNSINVWIDIF